MRLAMWAASFLLAGVAASAATPEQAQNLFDRVRDEVQALPKAERGPYALAHCKAAFAARDGEAMHPWCEWAYLSFDSVYYDQDPQGYRARNVREPQSPEAYEALRLAAWITAFDGKRGHIALERSDLQAGYDYGGRPTPEPGRAKAERLAEIAFFRTRFNWVMPQTFHADLAAAAGLPAPVGTDQIQQRRALIEALAARPAPGAADIWAAAAAITPFEYGFTDAFTPEAQAHYRALLPLLRKIADAAVSLQGPDAIARALLLDPAAKMAARLQDSKLAAKLFDEADAACAAAAWHGAPVCMDMRLDHAIFTANEQNIAKHPERRGRKAVRPATTLVPAAPADLPKLGGCRVLVRLDVGQDGVPANLRVLHSDPAGACDAQVLSYFGARRYETLKPGDTSDRIDLDSAFNYGWNGR